MGQKEGLVSVVDTGVRVDGSSKEFLSSEDSSSGVKRALHESVQGHIGSPYLDLDRPWEVADVDIKGDVGIASKGELLTRETVPVFLDVGFGHNGDLLSRDGASCWRKKVTAHCHLALKRWLEWELGENIMNHFKLMGNRNTPTSHKQLSD